MTKQNKVDNNNNEHNPVGRFMVAVGAIITNGEGKILLIRRSSKLDWHPGEWEIMYGRIAQHEDSQAGLAREAQEELGIALVIGKPLTAWHIYRGHEQIAHNELIGITFLATTTNQSVTISDEHEEYRWVTPQEALKLVEVDGIKRDINAYINLQGATLKAA